MLRFTPIANAGHAESYYSVSDGGYYLKDGGLHREWGGKAAARLGLSGAPDYEQFKRLIHGLHPDSGEQLTAKLIKERIPGWDVTASVPKGVTTALERGDGRIRRALWEAGREAMADLEAMATTRVRKGSRHEDRLTGNLLWYAKEDAETRPAKDDKMPDWDRHIHFVVFNLTHDAAEGAWKAVKFRPIMDLRKWFSHRFDLRLSHKLAGLGYEIEIKYKADGRGGKRYHTWDIKGIPQSVITKFSRRSLEVEKAGQQALHAMKQRDPDAPDELSPLARDKLGATSRLHKRDDLTLDDYRAYWNGRITAEEGGQIESIIGRARAGRNPKAQNTADKGVVYAIGHQFARNSVVAQKHLEITAMERCMGGALPEDIEPQLKKQGVLLVDGHATTEQVLAEEQRLVDLARQGRGRFRPLGDEMRPISRQWLNAGQQAAVRHVLASRDGVTIVRGVSGAGKTSLMQEAVEAIEQGGRKVVVLAPGTSTTYDVLRKDFPDASTVAGFLANQRLQHKARGQVLWVDEAGQLGSEDMLRLFQTAQALEARLVLSGDRRQHRSVARGEPLRLLEEKAGLPVAEVTEILRQSGDYKQAVAHLSEGKAAQAFAELDRLGWIKQVPDAERYQALASAYLEAVAGKKRGGEPATALVISPTHAEAARVTEAIRSALKAQGKLSEERTIRGWAPASLTLAEKGEAASYEPGDLLVFHQNVPGHRRGARMVVAEGADVPLQHGKHFEVYRPVELTLAVGDRVRVTANGRDLSGRHRLNNGDMLTVAGFTPSGDLIDQRGWVIPAAAGAHLAAGYCITSHASQGRTVDKVLVAQSSQSLAATNRRQFYVSVGRGQTQALIFTDDKKELLKAVQKADQPLSALELTQPRRHRAPWRQRLGKHFAYVRRLAAFARMQQARPGDGKRRPPPEREVGYAR